jgi:hypothetical protein
MNRINLIAIICLVLFASNNLLAQSHKYIGAAKCKECHNKPETGQQYNIWAQGAHANAIKTLTGEKALAYAKMNNIADPAKEPGCLKCHSTQSNLVEKFQAGITIEEGVSCESCHGPGSAYQKKRIMKDQALSLEKGMILPTTQACERQCHNNYNPFYKPFNYEESVKKIAHSNPAVKKN